ncbi:MAG: hypothetical protein MUC50_15125 [Myxococcota bacterium]|jgi:hypothetical protein|nr:hypothetical protein [Myxococcota bacterium]
MSTFNHWSMGSLLLVVVVLVGCARVELEDERGALQGSEDPTDTEPMESAEDDMNVDTTVGQQTVDESNTEETATQGSTTEEDTGPSPEDDSTCGASGQGCCGLGSCDNSSLVCVGGWPDEAGASCLPVCNGTVCNTTEGLDGTCLPTSDPTLTYCDGGTENPASKTCGAVVSCPGGSQCLVETAGATQGKCFKTGCDPYANCKGSGEICIPLIDNNKEPTGYGACIPLL